METRQLGNSDLQVSRIGFGGAPLGLQGYLGGQDKASEGFVRQAQDALRLALDSGVTFFDTAAAYGDGRSEELMGSVLGDRRDECVIATKFHQWRCGDIARLEATLDRSLRLLRTDHVDLLQLHGDWFRQCAADALIGGPVLEWAQRERTRGRTRYLGITAETDSGPLESLLRTGIFDTLQIAYSFIYQSHCDYQRGPRGVVPLARELGLGILSMRTATSGFLQRTMALEFPQADTRALTAFAIRFVLSTAEIDCALIGMTNCDQVRTNVALADDLSNRLDLAALNDRYALDLDSLHGRD